MKVLSFPPYEIHFYNISSRSQYNSRLKRKTRHGQIPTQQLFSESSLGAPRYSRDKNPPSKKWQPVVRKEPLLDQYHPLPCTVSSIALITITIVKIFVRFLLCDPHPGMWNPWGHRFLSMDFCPTASINI